MRQDARSSRAASAQSRTEPTRDRADSARARARELFLDDANTFGCAETTLMALAEAYGLPESGDSSAAMALNGGIAYSGATCGAITGAAMAVGRLMASRHADHGEAKRTARALVVDLMAAFQAEFGATTCRALTGADLQTEEGHRAFIESGAWRDGCMRQIEMAVGRLAPLADQGPEPGGPEPGGPEPGGPEPCGPEPGAQPLP